MKEATLRVRRQIRRKKSVRAGIRKNSDRPRLSVFRSSKHIYAQVIDDVQGRTLASASTAAAAFRSEHGGKTKTDKARLVGTEIARAAQEAGVKEVVFDRGAARFHGRVAALADEARKAGLQF